MDKINKFIGVIAIILLFCLADYMFALGETRTALDECQKELKKYEEYYEFEKEVDEQVKQLIEKYDPELLEYWKEH